MRRRSRNLWWLVSCGSRKRLRSESKLDIDDMLRCDLATIDEDSDTHDQKNGPENPRKRSKVVKKAKKEDIGRVFTAQFSLKNSYSLFLDRMTSSRSFGGLQVY
ncbi:hypothetical protein L1987_85702 [Smallanthus sonchifolius]|uniref:Uncharacterized protein n=1 Tax=Smallanthus sonchifolius TaxID=185202 RepID=A0ACB8XXB3_9ASTR|nr:hypothetical protein L1987_85702 [Smallanthus sonchifolius]